MTPELQFSGSSLLLILLGGAGLYVGLRYGRALVQNLPLNRGRKQVVDRFRPCPPPSYSIPKVIFSWSSAHRAARGSSHPWPK